MDAAIGIILGIGIFLIGIVWFSVIFSFALFILIHLWKKRFQIIEKGIGEII